MHREGDDCREKEDREGEREKIRKRRASQEQEGQEEKKKKKETHFSGGKYDSINASCSIRVNGGMTGRKEKGEKQYLEV